MRFASVYTLEIPQGATELTTCQLELISGGHERHSNNCQSKNYSRHRKSNKREKRGSYGQSTHTNNYCGGGDD